MKHTLLQMFLLLLSLFVSLGQTGLHLELVQVVSKHSKIYILVPL